MKRRLMAILVAGMLTLGVTPALAAELPANGGVELGAMISSMAPDCAKTMGVDFGKHVSIMAKGEDCGCPK